FGELKLISTIFNPLLFVIPPWSFRLDHEDKKITFIKEILHRIGQDKEFLEKVGAELKDTGLLEKQTAKILLVKLGELGYRARLDEFGNIVIDRRVKSVNRQAPSSHRIQRITSGGARIYETEFDETIPAGPADTVIGMFQNTVRKHPNRIATLSVDDNRIYSHTYQDLYEEVAYLALALSDKSDDGPGIKLEKGKDTVGLFSNNRWEWTVSDLAIQANGCANISIIEDESSVNINHVLSQTKPRIVVVRSMEQLEILQELGLLRNGIEKTSNGFIEHVIVMDISDSSLHRQFRGCRVHSYKELIEKGMGLYKEHPDMFSEMANQVSESNFSTITYTSGTTGLPKIVAFTNKQITQRMEGYIDLVNVPYQNDAMLSHLSFAWSFGRYAGHYLSIRTARAIIYSNAKKMWEDLKRFNPTFACFVPRMLEKKKQDIQARIAHNRIRAVLFRWSMQIAEESLKVPYSQLGFWKRVEYGLADLLVFRHLRKEFGGRMRYIISASAYLEPEIAEFYEKIGLPVIQYYGGGEIGVISRCSPQEGIKAGTCGPLAKGVGVEIDSDSQICVRAPWVITNYLYASEKDQIRTQGNFYQTGDKGEFDEEGFLVVGGRHEAVTLNTGRILYPAEVEEVLRTLPEVRDVLIVGNNLPCLIIIVSPTDRDLELAEGLVRTCE
ncbi:MAG: AMP-binding protein, partial [Candidatus Omnitrophica bacterium]|nr:AMP-binding protein [Candidatus Omnitrophota bacterium]